MMKNAKEKIKSFKWSKDFYSHSHQIYSDFLHQYDNDLNHLNPEIVSRNRDKASWEIICIVSENF